MSVVQQAGEIAAERDLQIRTWSIIAQIYHPEYSSEEGVKRALEAMQIAEEIVSEMSKKGEI